MNFNNVEEIKAAGFSGFTTISMLEADNYKEIPKEKGVYLILRLNPEPHHFLEKSMAGLYKGKPPTVSIKTLKESWVNNTIVLYIGKAGSGESKGKATLHSRLRQYIRFGRENPASHWGGRYIWQLEDVHDLQVCWKPTEEDPAQVESKLIEDFRQLYGKRPFANLVK